MSEPSINMRHCPQCGSVCLLSQSAIAAAEADGRTVAIACHSCNAQFGLDHNRATGTKRARLAKMDIFDCPSCRNPISVPDPLPDPAIVDLVCPLCDCAINPADLMQSAAPMAPITDYHSPDDIITTENLRPPERDQTVTRVPLYLLIIACLAVYLYWARETGHLPIDQWLKDFGITS